MGTVSTHKTLSLSPPPVPPPRAPIPVRWGGGGLCQLSREPVERMGLTVPPITGTVGSALHSFRGVTTEQASSAPVPTAGALWGASC
jgi:hypothetical protein